MKTHHLLFVLTVLCIITVPTFAQNTNLTACVESYDPEVDYFPDKVESDYSEVWDVEYFNHYKVLTTYPSTRDTGDDQTYVLVQCGTPIPELSGDLANALVIEIPMDRIFDATGVGTAGIEALGVADTLVGWQYEYSGAEYLPEVYARRDELVSAGYGDNLEAVVEAEPDVYLIFSGPDGLAEQRSLGIPAVWYDTWTDEPLGAAEQTKFISLFYNLEAEANALFDETEARYQELLEIVSAQPEQPNVLIGDIGTLDDGATSVFYTVDPNRTEMRILRDAGAVDLLAGQAMVQDFVAVRALDLETAISIADAADYWYNTAYNTPFRTVAEFIEAEPLNESFPALVEGRAFNVFARGEDMYATGHLRPDLMLADLISLMYPDALPDHELTFFFPITP
jgi:iron complex transport system substrate-binding protein